MDSLQKRQCVAFNSVAAADSSAAGHSPAPAHKPAPLRNMAAADISGPPRIAHSTHCIAVAGILLRFWALAAPTPAPRSRPKPSDADAAATGMEPRVTSFFADAQRHGMTAITI
jgi:hypothetical protein